MNPTLLVFGSINLDLSFAAERLPLAGETVLGSGCLVSPGGKGANQAYAAQRYGVATRLVGAVGDDAFAEPALARLRTAGVDLDGVRRVPGATGCAAIVVDAAGENQIVVAPGANARLSAHDVPDAWLQQARAVLVQMECDAGQTRKLLHRAHRLRCLTVLNNAPAQALQPATLSAVDLLVVNEGELHRTADGVHIHETEPERALQQLACRFGLTGVLTLGSRGVLAYGAQGQRVRLPCWPVEVVDTTGAGDTFSGVLAAAMIEGRPLHDALARAAVAASLACRRAGAQLAQPGREAVEAVLVDYFATLEPMG